MRRLVLQRSEETSKQAQTDPSERDSLLAQYQDVLAYTSSTIGEERVGRLDSE